MNAVLEDEEFSGKGMLWPFLKRIFKHSLKYKKWFWLLVLFTLLDASVDAVFPLLWLHYIDQLIAPMIERLPANGLYWEEGTKGLLRYGSIYAGVILFQAITIYGIILYTGRIREYVLYDLRKEMFDKLQRLSFSFYDRSAIGWLISRITSDTDRIAELISWGFMSFVWGSIMIILSFIVMFVYSWKLAFIVLLTLPLLFLVSVRIRSLIIRYSRKARKINSELTASYNENLNGIEVNKSTVQEEKAAAHFNQKSEAMRQSSFKSAFYTATYAPIVVMVGSIAAALVILWGGHQVVAAVTGITLGTWAAFFGYARNIFMPIFDITRFYALAQSSLSAGERIFSLIDEPILIKDKPGITDFGKIKGDIHFQHVYFHYAADKPILQDFDLHIRAGESIALVGPTGEGKSTIASLIGRFYEPVAGSILIDGVDYRERTLKSFRTQLGVVLQTPHLFSGTVTDNIRYGAPQATAPEMEAALHLMGASDLMDKLEEEVGEEGNRLSTGEKQLIAFARVILRNPGILIMDEATSSVDTLAEARIQQGIQQLIKGRTAIIIAHRLSTIKHCDRILVIQKGKIEEEGNHASLIAARGKYYQLYTRQARQVVNDERKASF